MVTNNTDNEDWKPYKQSGNDHFKSNNFEKAVVDYSTALTLCLEKEDKNVLYRNRAACHLKLDNFQAAFNDANVVVGQHPSDVKALFRRFQASEGLGQTEQAFKDIKRLIQIEPKNTAVQEAYRRITKKAQEKVSESRSTPGMINQMMEAITSSTETEERKSQALKNLVVYSHQSGPREILMKGGYIDKLMAILSTNAEYSSTLMKILHGYCENNYSSTIQFLHRFPANQMRERLLKYSSSVEHARHTLSLIIIQMKAIIDYVARQNQLKAEDAHKNMLIRENKAKISGILASMPEYTDILKFLVSLIAEPSLPSDSRDAVVDSFIQCISFHKAVSDFILTNRGIKKLLELASFSCYPMAEKTSPLSVNSDTYVHVSVALSSIHEQILHFEKDEAMFKSQAQDIIDTFINSQNEMSNIQGLVALSCLFLAVREFGNDIAKNNDNISKLMIICCREDELAQRLAAEALALGATDKTICSTIANTGLDILQALASSTDAGIRVRGLVAICKVCMKGGNDIKQQILDAEGPEKLYASCRKFLTSSDGKTFELRKWASEGLAYLTLDADVKEILVNDADALNILLDLAKKGDTTIMYGICSTFVNLTNAYDKPEKNPELEAIAEYAKQPLPKKHEKDEDDYVKKRIQKLMNKGLISALVNFTDIKSENTREMLARILNAVTVEIEHRGIVVAQGGVKTLLPLADKNTPKGITLASQALAKIGITSDPRLAFSGQRCMEVVRPLVRMLHFQEEPLIKFEGLMALTNLASMSDEVRRRIMKEKGFQAVESLMFEEDDEIKQAATECMCNLVLNEQAFQRYKEQDDCERVKLVTLYCGEDPPELSRAASGTLAILTSDADICKEVMKVKSCLEIFKYLVSSENLELRHRGLYVVANMLEASKDVASPLIEDELFEILMALKIADSNNANIKKELERCFAAAQKWNIIQENPENP